MRISRPAHGGRPQARRWLGPVLAALALAVLTAGPAAAQATAAEVAEQLRQSPVYVAPDAEAKINAGQVREHVLDAGTPIYIAVLPESAREGYGGSVTELGKAIANELKRNGTYMVVSGDNWAAGTYGDTIPRGEASRLASQAWTITGTTPRRRCSSGSTGWPRPPVVNRPTSPAVAVAASGSAPSRCSRCWWSAGAR